MLKSEQLFLAAAMISILGVIGALWLVRTIAIRYETQVFSDWFKIVTDHLVKTQQIKMAVTTHVSTSPETSASPDQSASAQRLQLNLRVFWLLRFHKLRLVYWDLFPTFTDNLVRGWTRRDGRTSTCFPIIYPSCHPVNLSDWHAKARPRNSMFLIVRLV
jgi:hypothetical protein